MSIVGPTVGRQHKEQEQMADEERPAFDAWLFGTEGFGLRIERLHEELNAPVDRLLPWLKAAFDAGRDSNKRESK